MNQHKQIDNELLNKIINDIESYANTQYRKYRLSSSPNVKNDPWVLGTSEGADFCVEIVKKYLTYLDE